MQHHNQSTANSKQSIKPCQNQALHSKPNKTRCVDHANVHLLGRHCTTSFVTDTLQKMYQTGLGNALMGQRDDHSPSSVTNPVIKSASPLQRPNIEHCTIKRGMLRRWLLVQTFGRFICKADRRSDSRSGETICFQIECFETIR